MTIQRVSFSIERLGGLTSVADPPSNQHLHAKPHQSTHFPHRSSPFPIVRSSAPPSRNSESSSSSPSLLLPTALGLGICYWHSSLVVVACCCLPDSLLCTASHHKFRKKNQPVLLSDVKLPTAICALFPKPVTAQPHQDSCVSICFLLQLFSITSPCCRLVSCPAHPVARGHK